MRFCEPPPTQAELEANLSQHGMHPIVHLEPFFGDPAHAPERPQVLAGLEFRVPVDSIATLPPFGCSSASGGRGVLERLRMGQSAGRAVSSSRRWMVPVMRPPSRAITDAWLKAEAGGQLRRQEESSAAEASSKDAEGSGFVMNPNTGQLMPTRSPAKVVQGSQGGTPASQNSSGLWGTPALGSALHADAERTPLRISRLAIASQPDQLDPFNQEEEVRPASPKYDERSFFYTTPSLHPESPAGKRPQSTGAAAPGSMGPPGALGPRPAAAAEGAKTPVPPPAHGRPMLPLPQQAAGWAAKRAKFTSQITPPSASRPPGEHTPVSQAGFKHSVVGKGQQLTLLSLEVQADCRGSLLPDPRYDAVKAVIMAVMDDDEDVPDGRFTARVLMCDDAERPLQLGMPHIQVERHATEEALLDALVEAVRSLDPDIILGWEVQQGSLGYLADRAALSDRPLLQQVSRTPQAVSPKDRQEDEYGQLHASGLHSSGRIILNLWRILRSELKLPIYTFEACVAALLQLRTPHIPAWALAAWFNQPPAAGGRWRCVAYWVARARLNLAMVEQLDLGGRTGELARTFGIDFQSVLTRGSQYRVESMLVRLAHTQNYLMLSPSRDQVARQPAMEAIPLVMEPESRFYADPMIVLDFQSLYPSIVIAYNLCFSTCVGRPSHAAADSSDSGTAGPQLGCSTLKLPVSSLKGALEPAKLIIGANGAAYAHPNARKGFSGRMPMAELADSIVQNARSTLEDAIRMVEEHPRWQARVVYGDTDSMFVLVPGRSRAAAFQIGAEIARSVTAANPSPVTLKLEKVYHPAVLLTKKRYVGMMFESPGQQEPTFDAKGIETVRRDTCPAVAKIMERSLRILFASRDLSQVRIHMERQWDKILAGKISVADFVFAKEVRLGTYSSRPGSVAPPAAIVAAHAMARDPRAEPRFAERIPYVVVYGAPGARLVDMVVPPQALVAPTSQLRLHALYYITKQIIPAMERVLSLMGVDIRAWFAALPRPQRLLPQKRPARGEPGNAGPAGAAGGGMGRLGGRGAAASTIDRYYLSRHCAVCDALTLASVPLVENAGH
ncbi:hypothetical protein WJX73_009136 [Symbiochloris irregularis]|uniref:DNA polymerase n=1 Tax=Symbiochloris irregularis TaxID=706552 RepID=A0AAW1NW27_9CHLO